MHTNTTGGEHDRPQHSEYEQAFYRVLSARYRTVGFPRGVRKLTVRTEDFATDADALEVRDYYRREAEPGEWAEAYRMFYGRRLP